MPNLVELSPYADLSHSSFLAWLMAICGVLTDAFLLSIPCCRVEPVTNDRKSLLFWVRTGRAALTVGGEAYALSAGEAIWIPAGVMHHIVVEAGSTTFPIFPPDFDVPTSMTLLTRLVVPKTWEDWMGLQFVHSIGYLRTSVSANPALSELLVAGSRTEPMLVKPRHGVVPPPMPRSPAASEVAHALLRRPGDPTEMVEYADRLQVGVRTLQHQFSAETGMPFIRWRAAARVAAAAAYLDAGQGIGWARQHVGFATSAGFTRAFREHAGCTPRDYIRSRQTRRSLTERSPAVELAKLSQHSADPLPALPPAPSIPPTSTWPCVNNFHVVVWVYRGTARVTIAGRTWRLRRGDAMWLPAGVHNSIEIDAGSLLLPPGQRAGTSPAEAPPLRVVHLPLAAEDWLLHILVASYTLVSPDGFDDQVIMRLIRSTIHASVDPAIAMRGDDPLQRMLAAVRNDPGDVRTLGDWVETFDTEATALHNRFVQVTGQSFPGWRASIRMTVARILLNSGALPGEIARRLGYADQSSFTHVFAKVHDMTPRTYHLRQHRADNMPHHKASTEPAPKEAQ